MVGRFAAGLIVVPASCALLGWLIGRWIRGRRSGIELERPRLACGSAFLCDAQNTRVSSLTRFRCAFESIYFCLCEVAETRGMMVEGQAHPCRELISDALGALDVRTEDARTVVLLATWVAESRPTSAGISIDEACRLAALIYRRTVNFLSVAAAQ